MKQITFLRLHATNFKCYVDFSFDFERFGAGCHSIRGSNKAVPRLGSNGVGKSTLWDALAFVLFGKTTKRLRSGDLVPYGSSKNPTVTLDLTVDGQPYRIERRAWPHAMMIRSGDPASDLSGSQEHIEQLIGIDLDLFLHTVVLAQGAPLFLDLEPRHKLSLLSDVLHLNRFEDYAANAAQQVKTIEQADNTQKMARMAIEGAIVEVESALHELRQQSEKFAASQHRNVTELEAQVVEAERTLNGLDAKRMAAKVDADALLLEVQDAHGVLSTALVQLRNGTQLRIKAGRMTVGSECPSCGQPVTAEARAILAEAAETLITDSNHEKLQSDFDALTTRSKRAQDVHDNLFEAARQADSHFNRLKATLKVTAEMVDPAKAQIKAHSKRKLTLEAKAEAIDAERDKLERERLTVHPWIDGFKQIRLIVLDDVLATLSLLTTSYANDIGLPCDVKFAIERSTKSGTTVSGIHMTVDGQEKFEAWSGGEAQRLRLAASLALSASLLAEAGLNLNLLALDEPSAHLSPEGLDELTQFLTTHAEAEGRTIFLTDQRPVNLASSVLLTRTKENVTVG